LSRFFFLAKTNINIKIPKRETIIEKKKKKECDSSCVSCSGGGENDCLSCNNSLYIENGRCVNQCSIGFYQNNDSHTCDSCPNVCLACSSRILPFSSFSFFSFYLIFF